MTIGEPNISEIFNFQKFPFSVIDMGPTFNSPFIGLSLPGEQTVSGGRAMGRLEAPEAHRTLPRTRKMGFEARYLVAALPPPPTRWWGWRGEGE